MTLFFIRSLFFIAMTFIGYYIGIFQHQPYWGMAAGAGAALVLFMLESSAKRVSVRGLSSLVFGLLLGLFMAKLLSDVLALLPLDASIQAVTQLALTTIFSYLGAVMALRGRDEFQVVIPYVRFRRQDVDERPVLLDTSAIIDGRIFDISRTKFFDRRLLVPRFVLNELHALADSKDPIKQQRGRRGLEAVNAAKADPNIELQTQEDDDVLVEAGVDAKLIRLARILEAAICTTDFNLNRVASVQGIDILHLNDLVVATRPVLMVGDVITIKAIKEGREPGQAVGFTADGTMVVIAGARDRIGEEIEVEVTSILPTQGGRMVFAQQRR